MSDGRKHMRIALPAVDCERFAAQKAKAEALAKVKFSDAQYATRLISWALEQAGKD